MPATRSVDRDLACGQPFDRTGRRVFGRVARVDGPGRRRKEQPLTNPDTDAAEAFAEEVGVDPTQEEINQYRQLEGDESVEEPPAAIGEPPAG